MEHAQPIGQTLSPRAVVLAVAVLIVVLCVRTLLHGGANAAVAAPKPMQPRSHDSVLVLNGNGGSGVAGALATRVLGRGYREAWAADAQVTTYARSVVLFRSGWARDAKRLAQDEHIHAVAPLDAALPATERRFPLVIVLGH